MAAERLAGRLPGRSTGPVVVVAGSVVVDPTVVVVGVWLVVGARVVVGPVVGGLLVVVGRMLVVVVGAAGERQSGIWGELMSNASRARGATGVVIDGGIRDGRLVREIDGLGVFARYTSPIESLRRSRIHDIEIPISMTGTTSSQVRVNPGDWIFGDEDGVLVIPKDALDEVLAKSEEAKDIEDKVREEVQAGVPVIDVYNKYGRL